MNRTRQLSTFYPTAAILLAVSWVCAPANAAREGEIRIQGPNSTYKIAPDKERENVWILKGPGIRGYSLRSLGNGSWVVLDPAKTIRQRAMITENRKMEILDPEGNLRHTIEFSGKDFKVIYPDGKILCHTKIIDENNFQIFDEKKKPIMSGKAKGKTTTVKDVKSKQRLFKIKGKISVEEAAYFSIPLQFTETVVFWRTASTMK